jgi:hypothetical protein
VFPMRINPLPYLTEVGADAVPPPQRP